MSSIIKNLDRRTLDSRRSYSIQIPEVNGYTPILFSLPEGDWSNTFSVYIRTIAANNSGSWGWRIEPGGGSGYAGGISNLILNAYINPPCVGRWSLTVNGKYFIVWLLSGNYLIQCDDEKVSRAQFPSQLPLEIDGLSVDLSLGSVTPASVVHGAIIEGAAVAENFTSSITGKSICFIENVPQERVTPVDLNGSEFSKKGSWFFPPGMSTSFLNFPPSIIPGEGFFLSTESDISGSNGIQTVYSLSGDTVISRTFVN